MVRREAITNELRFSIFQRDNFTCQYCGKKAPEIEIQLDHIIPVSQGGDNNPKNLITACYKCNLGKHCSRVYEKEDVESREAAERNRLNRISRYSYYTNYISKVARNAGLKSRKKLIDRFTSKNFSNDDEFNDFKKIFYKSDVKDVLELIENCVGSNLTLDIYQKSYTEKRQKILKSCEIKSVMDSRFIFQIYILMRNYWCDYWVDNMSKNAGYIFQIAEYFEAKHYDKTGKRLPESSEEEIIKLSNTLYCLAEFISDDETRMIKCFELIDVYFKSNKKVSFTDFASNVLNGYMIESGWEAFPEQKPLLRRT